MVLEFLQGLSEMQLVGELTVLSLLIGGIIMAGGVIIAKIAKLLFHKYYAPSLPKDTAQNISKLIYFGADRSPRIYTNHVKTGMTWLEPV